MFLTPKTTVKVGPTMTKKQLAALLHSYVVKCWREERAMSCIYPTLLIVSLVPGKQINQVTGSITSTWAVLNEFGL